MTIVQPATRRRRDGPGDHGSQGTPSLLQENDAVELEHLRLRSIDLHDGQIRELVQLKNLRTLDLSNNP